MIRATNGGFTCLIDPNGKITSWLEPFTAEHLTVDVPVYDEKETLYTRTDFLFDRFIMIFSVIMGVLLLVKALIARKKGK
jgi:apolipoprotein N-acyltransferase